MCYKNPKQAYNDGGRAVLLMYWFIVYILNYNL